MTPSRASRTTALPGSVDGGEIVVELGWGQGGPLMLNGIQWLATGDSVLLFLSPTDRRNVYQAVSTQGHYLVEDERVVWPVTGGHHHEESVVRSIESREFDEVARDVREGSRKAAASGSASGR